MIIPVLLSSPDSSEDYADNSNILKDNSQYAIDASYVLITLLDSSTYEPLTKDGSVAIKIIDAIFMTTL